MAKGKTPMASAARFGKVLNPGFGLWYKPAEVWPIIACISVAVGWTCYMSGRECRGADSVRGAEGGGSKQ